MAKVVKSAKKRTHKTPGMISLGKKGLERNGLWSPAYSARLGPKEMKLCHEYLRNEGFEREALLSVLPEEMELTAAVLRDGAKMFFSRKKIKDYLRREADMISMKLSVTTEKIVAEMASTAFSDIADFLDDDGNLDFKNASRITKKAIKSIKIRRIKTDKDEPDEEIVELVLHDKVKSLDQLGRHKGLFGKDNAQKAAADLTDEELLAEIKNIQKELGKS